MEENKIEEIDAIGASPEEEDGGSYSIPSDSDAVADEAACDTEEVTESDRDEYNRLIKTKFKELYSEDTQRLINRRFRKYRVLEEKCRVMEDSLKAMEASVAESEKKLLQMSMRMAEESARVAKETEERVISEIRARRLRPSENALSPRQSSARPDVSRLTKDERARRARRAADGEKIHF